MNILSIGNSFSQDAQRYLKQIASLEAGRYALGLLWYGILTGNEVENNSFCDFYEVVSAEEIAVIKKCVAKMIK